MLSRIAMIILRLHILRRAARLPVQAKLRYFQLCRRVHGVMIPVCAVLAIASVFIAICAFSPGFSVMVHLDTPQSAGTSNLVAFTMFLCAAAYFGTLFSALFMTRELLAMYWLLIFAVHYVRHEERA
jgi:hypothetical protein